MMEDWKDVEIGNILKTTSGGTPSRKNKSYYTGNIPWIKSGELDKGLILDSEEKISKEALDNSSAKIFPKGTLLIALYGATIGKLAILGIEASTNQAICGIFNNEFVNRKYLFNYLLYRRPKLVSQGAGGAQPNISQTILKKLNLPLAPLPIQRAIVSKIESLFSSLDSGIADLKKAQEQLKIYRQAVYSSTLPWTNLKTISDVVQELNQGWSPKCINQNSTDPNQWAVIKTSSIQAARFVDHENKILPESLEPRTQHEIKEGDILITRAGPRVRVGVCCLVKKTRPKLINCDKVYRLTIKPDKVIPQYFEFVLNSPEALIKIEKMKSGSNDSGLNLTQKIFLKMEVPIPSKTEQSRINREIESRLSVCDKVEESIKDSLDKAKALRQSILKKAFEGKLLMEAEIERCKQAADYEPASVLLERIRKDKLN